MSELDEEFAKMLLIKEERIKEMERLLLGERAGGEWTEEKAAQMSVSAAERYWTRTQNQAARRASPRNRRPSGPSRT